MLKPLLSPCDLIIGSRHVFATKAFTLRHGRIVAQPVVQVRHKVHRGPWRDHRRALKKNTATSAPPESKLNSLGSPKNSPSQAQDVPRENKHSGSDFLPTSSKQIRKTTSSPQISESTHLLHESSEEHSPKGYRNIVTDSVKPVPNQDLSSTRPAELDSPPGPLRDGEGNVSIADRAKYLYALGRSYLTFYKTGLKNVWNNRKEYKAIQARLGSFTPEDAALYGGQKVSDNDLGRIPTITRREYQLCLRTRHDLWKLVPFGLVLAICGEFTPIVILALGSSVVPMTCRIPKQVQSDRKRSLKRNESALDRELTRGDLPFKGPSSDPQISVMGIAAFGKQTSFEGAEYEAALAHLHGVSRFPSPLPILHSLWTLPRLKRRGMEIFADTVLIRREGGFKALEPIEICEYADRYFCVPFISENSKQLQRRGEILWDWDVKMELVPDLEEHSTNMLAHDWERVPESSRWHLAVAFEPHKHSTLA